MEGVRSAVALVKTQWQYLITPPLRFTHGDIQAALNKLGRKGWEVVAKMDEAHWLMKRRKR